MKHKHAEILKSIAENSETQIEGTACTINIGFIDITHRQFFDRLNDESWIFRIKPTPKPDVVMYSLVMGWENSSYSSGLSYTKLREANLKIIFDFVTGEPKSAEVIK